MHTKLVILTAIIAASAVLAGTTDDCKDHPLKPIGIAVDEWANTSVVAPATNMTFCKGLMGKDICLTPKGQTAIKARFVAKKQMFLAKRNAHLKKFNDFQTAFVAQFGKMVDVTADAFAEAVSTAMLGLRHGVNTIEQWDCQFFANGTLNPMDCRNRENETEWFMKNGKNIKKSVLKKIIQVGMALDAAMNGTLTNGDN